MDHGQLKATMKIRLKNTIRNITRMCQDQGKEMVVNHTVVGLMDVRLLNHMLLLKNEIGQCHLQIPKLKIPLDLKKVEQKVDFQ